MAEEQKQRSLAQYESIKKLILKPEISKVIQQMIPKIVNGERLLNVVLTMVRANDKLMECTQSSLVAGIFGILKLGLDPTLKQVYLIPFYNNRKKIMEATMIIDYRGYIAMARRSKEVKNVSARVVYEKDTFNMEYGTAPFLRHVPSSELDRGKIKGAYSVVHFTDGGESFEYMPLQDIEKRMAVSKTVKKDAKGKPTPADGTPWEEWFEEMATKTVIRHHMKFVPTSVEELGIGSELETRSDLGLDVIDLMPPEAEKLLEEGTAPGGPGDTNPVAVFDEKARKLLAQEEVTPWIKWLEMTAEGQDPKVQVDELKVAFGDEIENMVKAFRKWHKKAQEGEKKDEPN